MKYAIFGYTTPNLGDDVQALAAAALLPRVDAYVQRDRLDQVKLAEPHRLIMNSWFAVKRFSAVPSSSIIPVYFGQCIGRPELLNPDWIREWSRHQPIGCRDRHTVELLRSKQIAAHYTGCLTAYMGRFIDPPARREGIIFLDVPESIEHLIPQDIRRNAERMTNEIPDARISQKERYRKAAEILDRLRCAELVVTRRLHAALPCIGFQTPVSVYLFHDPKNMQRFSGPDEYVPIVFHNGHEADGPVSWRPPELVQIPKAQEDHFIDLLQLLETTEQRRFSSVAALVDTLPDISTEPTSLLRNFL